MQWKKVIQFSCWYLDVNIKICSATLTKIAYKRDIIMVVKKSQKIKKFEYFNKMF